MTEIIDLSLIQNDRDIDFLHIMTQQNQLKQKKKRLTQVVIWNPYQKRFWILNTVYFFQLSNGFTDKILKFYKKKHVIKGKLILLENLINLSFFLLDQKSNPIKCGSNYHRILLLKFSLQLNSNLEYFRLKIDSKTGQISFSFQLNIQSFFAIDVQQTVQFALNCYQQQIYGHLYTLQLLQSMMSYQNMYLGNINTTLQLIKSIINYKNQQFKKKQPFMQNIFKKNQCKLDNQENESTQYSRQSQQESNYSYIFDQEQLRQTYQKDLKKYLIKNQDQKCQNCKFYEVRSKFKAQVEKFYLKDKIFSINLIKKPKMNNIIVIQIKQNKIIQKFIQMKALKQQTLTQISCVTSNYISNSAFPSHIFLQQKNSNKNLKVEVLKMPSNLALQQYYICQSLTKFQSLRFVNQYVKISNFSIIDRGFVLVYHIPSKMLLKNFLQNNKNNLSLISKSALAYHLIVIAYTIHQKNKLINYFPSLSLDNIEISSNYSLNLKTLTNLKVKYFPSLQQLLQTLYYMFFQKTMAYQRQVDQLSLLPFSADEINNKFTGPSSYVNLIKFYILHFSYIWKKCTTKFFYQKSKLYSQDPPEELRQDKKNIKLINSHFMQICENLMILFGYLSEFLGKQGNLQSNQQGNQNS